MGILNTRLKCGCTWAVRLSVPLGRDGKTKLPIIISNLDAARSSNRLFRLFWCHPFRNFASSALAPQCNRFGPPKLVRLMRVLAATRHAVLVVKEDEVSQVFQRQA